MKWVCALPVVAMPIAIAAQPSPIDLDLARAYFAELRELGRQDGGRLWGRPVAGPMLFVDPNTRAIVANVRDPKGALREEKGVWIGALPSDQSPANTSIDFNGTRWSMVMWPITDSRYGRGRLLMHESFHRIQRDLKLQASDRANSHLATAEARIWTRLEWRALTEALLRTGTERKHALRDALTFRAHRRALFSNAAEDERQLELNEGLAEYTGYALSGLPHQALYDRIAVQLANNEQQSNFARSFAYTSGPAYALLLDAAGTPWRKRVRSTSDLSAMARAAYGIGAIDHTTAAARLNTYKPARMIAEEREREKDRVATETRLRAKFVQGSTVTLPVAGKFNYSFDPNAATPVQDVGTVFDHSRVTDDWGVLEVSSGGVLMRRTNGAITHVIVAAPPGDSPPTKTAEWTLELSPGWVMTKGARAGDWVVTRADAARK